MGEQGQHDGFRRTHRRGPDRGGLGIAVGGRRVQQVAHHVDDPLMDRPGGRVLVKVDEVDVAGPLEQFIRLGLHPHGHEAGGVQGRVGIEIEFVEDDALRGLRRHALFGDVRGGHPVAHLAAGIDDFGKVLVFL